MLRVGAERFVSDTYIALAGTNFHLSSFNRRTKREQNQAGLDYAEQGGGKAYKVGLIFIALPFEYLLEAEHLVAVLGGLGKVELLGGLLHELARAGDALLQLATRHVLDDGVGGFSQLRIED